MKLSISTNRAENILGYVYLLVSLFILPVLISLIGHLLGVKLSLSVINIVYFVTNFMCIITIFHRFLRQSVQALIKNPWRCLRFAALGLGLYFVSMILFSFVIVWIDPNFSNVNDNAIAGIAQENTRLISFCTIFLVPITEETLYRGLVFQRLQRKSLSLGYCVSMVVFSLIHITGFIGTTDWRTLLICFIQYLPAGFALAWAYEHADNIIAPILIHITINQIGMSALR